MLDNQCIWFISAILRSGVPLRAAIVLPKKFESMYNSEDSDYL